MIKILITSTILAFTLSACKPGIYYDPKAAQRNAQLNAQKHSAQVETRKQPTKPTQEASSDSEALTAPPVKAPIPGEEVNMIVPG